MKDERRNKSKVQRKEGKGRRYSLKGGIRSDQRKYIEGVRKWLHEPLTGKGKMVGGPV